MRKKAKQDDSEIGMAILEEPINGAAGGVSREGASDCVTREALPNVKAASTPEECREIKRYAEERLGIKLLNYRGEKIPGGCESCGKAQSS